MILDMNIYIYHLYYVSHLYGDTSFPHINVNVDINVDIFAQENNVHSAFEGIFAASYFRTFLW